MYLRRPKELADAINKAMEWPSWERAQRGIDPFLAVPKGSPRDPGEITYLLVTLSHPLTREQGDHALEVLRGAFEKIAALPAQQLAITLFADKVMAGVPSLVLPVLIRAPYEFTPAIVDEVFGLLREEVAVPTDTEAYPYTPILLGGSAPNEAAWCLYNLLVISRWRGVELPEPEMFYLVDFLVRLAEQQLIYNVTTNELYAVGSHVQESGLTDWRQWRSLRKTEPPAFAAVLSPADLLELHRREGQDRSEYLSRILQRIYVRQLAELRKVMSDLRNRSTKIFTPFHVTQILDAIVLSRVVGTEVLLGGGPDIGETIRSFDGEDTPPEDEPTQES